MGKKGTPNTNAKLASNGKKSINKSPKQKPAKVAAQEDVDMLFPENDDEWEDESDDETALKFSKKGNKSKKAVAVADEDDESDSDSDSEGGGGFGLDLARLDESDSDSEIEEPENDDEDDGEEGDEEEEDIDIDDLSINGSDEEEIRATMRVRETINNKDGLLAALKRIALDTSPSSPFVFHQSVVSSKPTADAIPSIDDDLVRELAFMNQALEAARFARTQLRKEGVPFTRPTDYFAETVRSDEIMDKVKAKLIEEATSKKASAEARKLRDLKKFGKQVQVAKQQERAKEKKATLEKISLLKKKRKDGASSALGAHEADDLFDVAVEKELKGNGSGKKRSFSAGEGGDRGGDRNNKRQKKDSKYGFGGKKRHVKENDKTSAGDISGFSARGMKSSGPTKTGSGPGRGAKKPFKAPRLGKSRRKAGGK